MQTLAGFGCVIFGFVVAFMGSAIGLHRRNNIGCAAALVALVVGFYGIYFGFGIVLDVPHATALGK